MLPSLFASEGSSQRWRPSRAAGYGAGIGLLAALIKIFGPFRGGEPALAPGLEIGLAVFAFALLCAGAALLRNRLARRLQDLG
jgi:hypothetical protein